MNQLDAADTLDLLNYVYERWSESRHEAQGSYTGFMDAFEHAKAATEHARCDGACTALSQVMWEVYKKATGNTDWASFKAYCDTRWHRNERERYAQVD